MSQRISRSRATAEEEIQRAYYARVGHHAGHGASPDEHRFPLSILLGALDYLDARSVLEVGAGSGSSMAFLKAKRPDLHVAGVEPVPESRELAYQRGIGRQELVEGSVLDLPFPSGSVDVVCALAVLHHVREHGHAVSEMIRVARKAVFISDGNNFGQGGPLVRFVKQMLKAARLWSLADWAKTRGKGYTLSEGDGLAYSYSVFSDYELLAARCRSVHVMNTVPAAGMNPYRTASHVVVLAMK